ncbi:hypothetical protein EST38_g13702 [Candolleomyces aberdarensis]|uniref:Ribonuclease H1 N-terminal domain-containing protein n=1 Tax=Candolleomyces aberdarensis TaxID=2316362 RepID=A0A4Q2D0C1_9AGAR|nr:hypothetical protein EST38_g13702 [Candolleomyces aberdarensis]
MSDFCCDVKTWAPQTNSLVPFLTTRQLVPSLVAKHTKPTLALTENHQKNLYIVYNGREIGIFLTWPEAQAQITGYSNNSYEGFTHPENARIMWAWVLDNEAWGQVGGGSRPSAQQIAEYKAKEAEHGFGGVPGFTRPSAPLLSQAPPLLSSAEPMPGSSKQKGKQVAREPSTPMVPRSKGRPFASKRRIRSKRHIFNTAINPGATAPGSTREASCCHFVQHNTGRPTFTLPVASSFRAPASFSPIANSKRCQVGTVQ